MAIACSSHVPLTLDSMATLATQTQLRLVRDLPFCYVCGKAFVATDSTDHDHVPAKSCFDLVDRNPPLKLRTHVQCNNGHTQNDEKLGELIAIQRHKALDSTTSRQLRVSVITEDSGDPRFAYFNNLDVIGSIRRWVCGFHAALYGEPLDGNWFQVTPPLPYGTIEQNSVRVEPVLQQHLTFVEVLKSNRSLGRIDSIVTCSGKMRYECVWAEIDDGRGLFCIFGLDIYGWIGLGDAKNFGSRGCTGAYMRRCRSAPIGASTATRFAVPFENRSPFDPFGA